MYFLKELSNYEDYEKIMPVEEILHEDEFTGRVEILRALENWIESIGRVGAESTAIIAPRRMGKTVLLDRLVNTIFFKPQYKVAPFYFKMKREETTLRKFLLMYATTFFRQYIAYCLQDSVVYRRTDVGLDDLLNIQSDIKPVAIAQDFIKGFLRRYDNNGLEDARNHWDDFIKVPEDIASFSGIRVAVIIDEFQDMKFSVYDTSENSLEKLKFETQKNFWDASVDLTSTYDRQALSKKAPMLVTGSAVTLIFRTVMGGPLGGRFGFKYLRPLSIDDGATLMVNLVKLYVKNKNITPENALYASTQVNGHPYYLYCLATSDFEQKEFTSFQIIDEIIKYEIEEGKIYGFWQTHFDENKEYINNDNDIEIGKKIIYYFTRYNNKEVDIDEIARDINISKEYVEKKIEKLYHADLVYRTKARYYGFKDICLMRYIKYVYEKDITGVKKIDLSELGMYNILKGRFLELVVQQVMSKFNNESLKGELFGKEEDIIAPCFMFADTRYAKGENTNLFQIDVFGKILNQETVWLCECKYRLTKMGMGEVKKLEAAKEAFLKQEAQEKEPHLVPKIKLWYVSTGGFTDEALDYLVRKEDVYYSNYKGINEIFRRYGGGFDIPVFYKE